MVKGKVLKTMVKIFASQSVYYLCQVLKNEGGWPEGKPPWVNKIFFDTYQGLVKMLFNQEEQLTYGKQKTTTSNSESVYFKTT